MGVKKSKPTQVVVMSSNKRFAKRQVVGLLFIGVLVLLATGVTLALINTNKKDDADVSTKPKTTADVIKTTDSLRYSKDVDKAVSVATEAYNDSTTDLDKYNIAQQTGVIYETNKDYKKAIEWYLKAEGLMPGTRGALVGLARCYDADGQKDKAIEYYKKVIALKDVTGQGVQNETAYYQYQLDKLTGAKQ
jgi:tetratricopeptide (TPR) repeat protein